jgi:hypothetical protein
LNAETERNIREKEEEKGNSDNNPLIRQSGSGDQIPGMESN